MPRMCLRATNAFHSEAHRWAPDAVSLPFRCALRSPHTPAPRTLANLLSLSGQHIPALGSLVHLAIAPNKHWRSWPVAKVWEPPQTLLLWHLINSVSGLLVGYTLFQGYVSIFALETKNLRITLNCNNHVSFLSIQTTTALEKCVACYLTFQSTTRQVALYNGLFMFSQSKKIGIQDRCVSRVGFFWRWLSPLCVFTWSSLSTCLCPHFLFLKGHQSEEMGTHPNGLIFL